MNIILYFILTVVSAGLMFGTYFLTKKKKETKVPLVNKILAFIIFALMFVWLLLSKGGLLKEVFALKVSTPFWSLYSIEGRVKFVTALGLLSMWFIILAHVIALVSPFFEFKIIHRIERLVSPILLVFLLATLHITMYSFNGAYDFTAAKALYCVELGLLIGKVAYLWAFDRMSLKMTKSEIIEFVLCVLGAFLFTIPSFVPKAMFGNPKTIGQVLSFATYHRYAIYSTLVFLVGLSMLLRDRKGEYSRMVLLFICYGGMIAFSYGYSFDIFVHPYDWPLHICNTAMYILPIALITKSEKIFYFTFFVNILGAFLAILMPNFDASESFFGSRVFGFYTNHIEAMAMPLVCVLTGVFPRPMKKQFFYSMVGFAIYFLMAIVFNTWFTAVWPEHKVDFFYINSTFVAEKVHLKFLVTDFKFSFSLNGKQFTMYPLYQTIYFLGFIILSIGMWYVYVWIFKFQDKLIYLNMRSKKMKLDAIALQTKFGEKEVKKCMNPESVNKLIISDFGKRYSNNSPFAVRNINFEAHGGEIIGFLGPNGAGKSTTIKAIVGIHLPTEGKIEVNGYDVAVQPVQAKRQLGFVPDHYALYENLTGREYLNYIADLYEVTIEDRDKFLTEFLDLLAMEDAIDSKIQTYSHGMKQKIAIMASLIHNPKLWILDEPLTGLDPVSIFQVKQCLKHHAEKGNIVFFSSHLIDIVEKLCDRIVIISDHKVVDVADVKELTKKGVNLEQYYMDKTGLATGN